MHDSPCDIYTAPGLNNSNTATLPAVIPSDESQVRDALELTRTRSRPAPSSAPLRATRVDRSPMHDTQCWPEACLQLRRATVPQWNQLPTRWPCVRAQLARPAFAVRPVQLVCRALAVVCSRCKRPFQTVQRA